MCSRRQLLDGIYQGMNESTSRKHPEGIVGTHTRREIGMEAKRQPGQGSSISLHVSFLKASNSSLVYSPTIYSTAKQFPCIQSKYILYSCMRPSSLGLTAWPGYWYAFSMGILALGFGMGIYVPSLLPLGSNFFRGTEGRSSVWQIAPTMRCFLSGPYCKCLS